MRTVRFSGSCGLLLAVLAGVVSSLATARAQVGGGVPSVEVQGTVFDDADGDEVRSEGEGGVASVRLRLAAEGGGRSVQEATTAKDGTFRFLVLPEASRVGLPTRLYRLEVDSSSLDRGWFAGRPVRMSLSKGQPLSVDLPLGSRTAFLTLSMDDGRVQAAPGERLVETLTLLHVGDPIPRTTVSIVIPWGVTIPVEGVREGGWSLPPEADRDSDGSADPGDQVQQSLSDVRREAILRLPFVFDVAEGQPHLVELRASVVADVRLREGSTLAAVDGTIVSAPVHLPNLRVAVERREGGARVVLENHGEGEATDVRLIVQVPVGVSFPSPLPAGWGLQGEGASPRTAQWRGSRVLGGERREMMLPWELHGGDAVQGYIVASVSAREWDADRSDDVVAFPLVPEGAATSHGGGLHAAGASRAVGRFSLTLYEDEDGDGAWTPAERGVGGLPYLVSEKGSAVVVAQGATARNGEIAEELPVGVYQLHLLAPAAVDHPLTFSIISGVEWRSFPQGIAPHCGIQGRVTSDLTPDLTLRSSGEGSREGIGHLPVILWSALGERVASVMTDADGGFSLPMIPWGAYTLDIDVPDGALSIGPSLTPKHLVITGPEDCAVGRFGFHLRGALDLLHASYRLPSVVAPVGEEVADRDADGLPDHLESPSACPFQDEPDSDWDGVFDLAELLRGSDPCRPDPIVRGE